MFMLDDFVVVDVYVDDAELVVVVDVYVIM